MITMSSILKMQYNLHGKSKNRLDHAFAVTSWALSLQAEIQADCMEQLSTDNGDLRKLVDEVVSQFHYDESGVQKY